MSDISLNSPFIKRGLYFPRLSQAPEHEALEHELTIAAENTVTVIGWSAVRDNHKVMDMALSSLLGWRAASRLRVSDRIRVATR
jgi:hypothetical protein